MGRDIKTVNYLFALFIAGLTILFGSALFLEIKEEFDNINDYALIEGKASYNKDLLYRRWASMHGGVYVPITDETPPNPVLSHIPDRDITSEYGVKLTLVNPAYMTRQVHEIAAGQYGVKGHITSLNPIREENKPDEWETKALHLFETGKSEYSSIEKIDGTKHMRYMHSMTVEQSCLKCHAVQGYQVGDVRGGISVSVPMDTYDKLAAFHIKTQAATYLFVYAFVLFLTGFGFKRLKKEILNRNLLQTKIIESEALLSRSQEMAHVGSWELDLTANKLKWSDETYRIFGCQPQECAATYEAFLGFIHPDDCAAVEEAYSGSLREGIDGYEIEHRIVRKETGEIRHVYERCVHVRDDADAIIKSIGMVQDITEDKQAEELNRKSAERTKMQSNLIAHLTFEESIVNSSLDDALKILTSKLSATLQIDRVSVWLLSENEKKLQRLALYDAGIGLDSPIEVLNTADIPSYFKAMRHDSQVDADDAQNDIRTKELTDNYLIPLQISSLLDSAIQQDGRLIGILSAEHRGQVRKWHADEKSFLSAVTNLVAQLFANAKRKQAEVDLTRMTRIMKNSQEIAHLGSFEYIAATQTTIWSEEEYRIYGLDPNGPSPEYNEMLEKCIHPDDAKLLHDAFMAAMQRQGVYELEHRIVRPDGSVRWVYDKANPYFDEHGNLLRYVGATLDITERKHLQEELENLNDELELKVKQRTALLEASNEELEAFSYSVSHDLRAPLRHINGYIGMLNQHFSDELPEKARHYLDTISGASSQMGALIDDLLQYSRTGRQEIIKKELDMNLLVKEVFEELKSDATGREIYWDIQKLPNVYGDNLLLKQVWANLMGNAVKYTRNQQTTEISVGCKEETKEFVFWIADNGVGFDMKYAYKLFGVFQRLHSQSEFEGTGIGLANVQRIVHKHLGRVWVEAEPGKGAKFYFSLPKYREGKS